VSKRSWTGKNICGFYPEEKAREVMALSAQPTKHGGSGRLKNHRVTLLDRNGNGIPTRLDAAIVYEGDREVATIGFFHDLRKEMEKRRNSKE
jgi:two-component system NtrC family sensor kinase